MGSWFATLIHLMSLGQVDCVSPQPVLLGRSDEVVLTQHLLVRADQDGLSAQQVAAQTGCEPARPVLQSDQTILGDGEPAWYRFRLTTVGVSSSDWILRVPAIGLPSVCVYWPMRDDYQRRCEGAGQGASHGDHYAFPLPETLDSSQPVLLHVAGGLASPHPMSVVTRARHEALERGDLLGTGFYIGLLVTIVVLSWVAFASQRHRAYLYLSGLILASALSQIGFLGRGLVASGTLGVWLATAGPPVFASVALACLVLFVRSYLDIKRADTLRYGLSLLALVAAVLTLILAMGRPASAVWMLPFASLLTAAAVVGVSGLAIMDGSRSARYLLASTSVLTLGLVLTSSAVLFGEVGLLRVGAQVISIGTLVMPVVLVLAVYRNYRSMSLERDHARGALLAEQRLALLRSSYCRLTGLPRRGRISELFSRLIRASNPDRVRIGLYLLHIDNLDTIRRHHGREVLEQVVNILARRLRDGLEEDQLLGRLDDWELVMIVPTTVRDDDFRKRLYEAAQGVADCVQQPMEVNGQQLTPSLSAGLAIWPLHGQSFDELMRRCDSALYEAQAAGGNLFKVFDGQIHEARTHQFRRIADLREAMELGQLEMHYQPIHAADHGGMVSMEALIRWQHPEHDLILPSEFIPLAEDSDLILDIGAWSLSKVLEDMRWLTEHGWDLPVAVNVSPRQFGQPGFADQIIQQLADQAVDPCLLRVEITEDSLIENMEQTRLALSRLRSRGVKVYVDDFGVGYSSLNYIRSLPIHGLKIDRSFVQNIGRTSQDEAVVKTIIRLALSLDLNLVSEGVETDYQRDFLADLGCNSLQGFLYSPALRRDQLIGYRHNRRLVAAS